MAPVSRVDRITAAIDAALDENDALLWDDIPVQERLQRHRSTGTDVPRRRIVAGDDAEVWVADPTVWARRQRQFQRDERDRKRQLMLASRVARLIMHGRRVEEGWEIIGSRRVACWVLRHEGVSHVACASDAIWPRSEPKQVAPADMRRCAACQRRAPSNGDINVRLNEMLAARAQREARR